MPLKFIHICEKININKFIMIMILIYPYHILITDPIDL